MKLWRYSHWLIGAAVTGLALHGYYGLGLVMRPDFELYTVGGVGLFPSPLGRLLGAAGSDVFAVLSALAAGSCAVLAGRRGALLLVVSPATLYLMYAGIDPIGLALLLLGVVHRRPAFVALAALAHLSLAPFALLLMPRATVAAKCALGSMATVFVGCLLLTPYARVVYGVFHPDALVAGLTGALVGLLLGAPAFVFNRVGRLPKLAYVVGVLECVAQHHLQARYLLPAALLAAASPSRGPVRAAAVSAAGRARAGLAWNLSRG